MSGPNKEGFMDAAVKERPEVEDTAMEELEKKSKNVFFKMASVAVYVCAVTGNGFLLSVFYLFLWTGHEPVERPPDVAPDRGLFGRWAPDYTPDSLTAPDYLKADHLMVDDDKFALQLKDKNPSVPMAYRRIIFDEFTNKYINNHHVPGSKHVIPEAPSVLSSQEQEEYEHNGSTAADHDVNSPQHHDETNMHVSSLGSEYSESTSTSNGGPSTTSAMQQQAIPVSQS